MTENLSFEDILDDLMLDEDEPTPEALARWSERYPQYRKELARFFETWAAQAKQPQRTRADEDKLVAKGVSFAMTLLRQRGRVIPVKPAEPVGPFDELVLTAVYMLRGEGHGANITEKVGEISEKETMLGTVFMSLNSLENRGLISSWTPEGQ